MGQQNCCSSSNDQHSEIVSKQPQAAKTDQKQSPGGNQSHRFSSASSKQNLPPKKENYIEDNCKAKMNFYGCKDIESSRTIVEEGRLDFDKHLKIKIAQSQKVGEEIKNQNWRRESDYQAIFADSQQLLDEETNSYLEDLYRNIES